MSEEQSGYEAQAMPFFFAAGAVVAIMWGWYAFEHFTENSKDALPIFFPLAVTVLAPIAATAFWRRAVGIAKNGVPGMATVLSVGGKIKGLRDVEFEFEFDGATYTNKTSIYDEISDKLRPGDEIVIVIDKRKPTRVLVK